jgi:pimeloyl-ACP methyl ester carboxylesterase
MALVLLDIMHTIPDVTRSAGEALLASPVKFQDVGTAEIAYRSVGSGPPVLFLHGWPLSGLTYRKLIPELAQRFTCYAIDLPGAGRTRWRDGHDFSFTGQAKAVERFVDALGLRGFDVVAHDTGGTIARALALNAGERIGKVVLIGTEIPGHRPPWISLFQRLSTLPLARPTFQLLLSAGPFVRSGMGFGNCFMDRGLIAGEFTDLFVRPLLESNQRMEGQIRYLRGIDWALVDRLAEDHRRITNPVLLIWGERDSIFPPQRARVIAEQLADCRGFVVVPNAKLLAHEEQPHIVADHITRFLLATT